MVGVLEWKDHKNFASFDKTNRIDAKIVKFFQKNGLPNDHICIYKTKPPQQLPSGKPSLPF